jgi:hypothetical protein
MLKIYYLKKITRSKNKYQYSGNTSVSNYDPKTPRHHVGFPINKNDKDLIRML